MLDDGVRMVPGQDQLDVFALFLHRLADRLKRSHEQWHLFKGINIFVVRCEFASITIIYYTEYHLLKNAAADLCGVVGHGAVLDLPGEHDHVPRLALQLDGGLEEVLSIVRVARPDVGPGHHRCRPVLRGEGGQQSDNLSDQVRLNLWQHVLADLEAEHVGGRQGEAARHLWPEVAVVRVVQVGVLPRHPRHHLHSAVQCSAVHCSTLQYWRPGWRGGSGCPGAGGPRPGPAGESPSIGSVH